MDKLESVKAKLEESKQLLKTNENVINWLNKQVNEAHFHRRPVGMFDGAPSGGPQVAYKHATAPSVTSSSSIPVSRPWSTSVMTYSSTIPPIPEEISPTPRSTITRPAAVLSRSSEPALDMKYLQQKHQQVGFHQPGVPQMSSGPKPGPPHPSTSTPASNGAPSLMSAYFPQQLQTTT
ncbi:spindle assembly abnormal protein 6 homolog [Amphiura filiformis]|uniref:spindle assembly abnormal protein 6 homolog n=1 Tax=Amphiura filiformis TaxID=82378 RepID=UPI003B21D87D